MYPPSLFRTMFASFVMATLAAPAMGQQEKTIARQIDPVVVRGEAVRPFWGQNIEQLRVYAYSKGEWKAIAFQIDKVDTDGNYMIDLDTVPDDLVNEPEIKELFDKDQRRQQIRPLNNKQHAGAYFAEDVAVMDDNDELVFMIRDAGDRAPRRKWLIENSLEIELIDPVDGSRAWVYLLHFAENIPPKSTRDYVRYDPVNDTIISQQVEFDFDNDRPLIIERLIGKPPGRNAMPDILDRFKLRITVKPRILFCLSLQFDENNTRSFVAGYIDGPVRVIRRNLYWIILGGIKLPFAPKMIAYIKAYEYGLAINTEYYIPVDMQWFLCKGSSFMAGLDLLESTYGAKIFSKDNTIGTMIIDGKMSKVEQQLVTKDQSWVAGYLPNGAALISRMLYDEQMIKLGATLNLSFTDNADLNDGPEEESGQHFVGHTLDLKRFPAGKYQLAFRFYAIYDFQQEDVQQVLNIDDQPLMIHQPSP